MHDIEIKDQVIAWLKTSITIREPKSKAALARQLGITPQTINNWQNELKNGHSKRVDKLIDQLTDFTDEEIMMFRRRAFTRAMEANASAKHMELFAKLTDQLIDKSEMKVKISADANELARLDLEAERRVRALEQEGGAESLQEEPLLLPQEIRES